MDKYPLELVDDPKPLVRPTGPVHLNLLYHQFDSFIVCSRYS